MSGTSFAAVKPDRLADAAQVFGSCGAAEKCWCAYWYLPNAAFKAGWGTTNADHFRALVRGGTTPGLIAYRDGTPVGWVSVAPRRIFDRLNRSRPLAPVDDVPVWSCNCFVVAKPWRRQGLMRALLGAAVGHAAAQGAPAIEGYPVDEGESARGWDMFRGTPAMFREAGFIEHARRLRRQPVFRKDLTPPDTGVAT